MVITVGDAASAVGVVILCVVLHLVLGWLRMGKTPLPPGPVGYPVVGVLPMIRSAPHSIMARMAERYGPIMYFKIGTHGAVVASSASAAKLFLTTFDSQFANRPNPISAHDITYGFQNLIFSHYSPRLKLLRKMLSLHLLGPHALSEWTHVRRTEAGHLLADMLNKSRVGDPVVVNRALIWAMANIMGCTTLSSRMFQEQGKESTGFKDMILDLLTGVGLFNLGDFVPALAWMDLQGVQAKMKRIHRKYDALITNMLHNHGRLSQRESPDFIDRLLAARNDGTDISDTNIKALVFDIFTAGTDTVTIILEWALAEMIKNPDVLRRAQKEMDEVIGKGRRMEESDIPNLPYLQATVKEALRLHPSTPLSIPHYTLEECEVEGYRIPANTRLLVNIWAIGRDPAVWDDPLRFDPGRFLSGRGAGIDPMGTNFELIPFGAGRRICAGKQAGMLLLHYFLGTLVHAFDWVVPDAQEMNMEETPGLVLPKAVPLTATILPRLPPHCYCP